MSSRWYHLEWVDTFPGRAAAACGIAMTTLTFGALTSPDWPWMAVLLSAVVTAAWWWT